MARVKKSSYSLVVRKGMILRYSLSNKGYVRSLAFIDQKCCVIALSATSGSKDCFLQSTLAEPLWLSLSSNIYWDFNWSQSILLWFRKIPSTSAYLSLKRCLFSLAYDDPCDNVSTYTTAGTVVECSLAPSYLHCPPLQRWNWIFISFGFCKQMVPL